MKKFILPVLLSQLFAYDAFADNNRDERFEVSNNTSQVEDLNESIKTPVSYLWVQGASPRKGLVKSTVISDPLMTLHGGNVMPKVNTTLIFWGKSWGKSTFVSDKIEGLNYFYNNFQNSTYAGVVGEYLTGSLNHALNPQLQKTDVSSSANSSTSAVLSEVCKVVGSANIVADGSGYYAVYSDLKRGNANYCAYHSAGTCGGKPLQFAFFFNLDGDAGCDPQSSYAPQRTDINAQAPGYVKSGINSVYAESQGLAALASVTAHELAETITDPVTFPSLTNAKTWFWGGWFDSLGAENGDKCAWTFGPSAVDSTKPGTVLIGNIPWKLQGEWSNTAQNNHSGYLTNGLNGCVSGS